MGRNRLYYCWIVLILFLTTPCFAGTKTIADLINFGVAPSANDVVPFWDTSESTTNKISIADLFTTPNVTGDLTIGSNGDIWFSSSERMIGVASDAERILFRNDWNYICFLGITRLGVGTESPTKALHVVGDIYASGDISCGGSLSGLWNLDGSNIYYNAGDAGFGEPSPEGQVHVTPTNYDEALILEIPSIGSLPNAGYTQAPVITWQGGETKFGNWRQTFNGYEASWMLAYNSKWNYEDNTWEGRDSGNDAADVCAYMRFNVAEGGVGGNTWEVNFAKGGEDAGTAPDWNSGADYFFYDGASYNHSPQMLHMRAPGNSDVTIRMCPDEGATPHRAQIRNTGEDILYIENLVYGSTSYGPGLFSQITEPIIAMETDTRDVAIGHDAPTADLHIQGNMSQELPNTCTSSGTTVTSTAHNLKMGDTISLPSGASDVEEVFLVAGVTDENNVVLDSAPSNAVTDVTCHTDSDLLKVDDGDGREQFNIDKRGLITINGLTMNAASESLADDGWIQIEDQGTIVNGGFGWVVVGDNEEHSQFWIDEEGGIILFNNTGNIVANADTDAKFCINIASAPAEPIYLKNRLGDTKRVSYVIYYY